MKLLGKPVLPRNKDYLEQRWQMTVSRTTGSSTIVLCVSREREPEDKYVTVDGF